NSRASSIARQVAGAQRRLTGPADTENYNRIIIRLKNNAIATAPTCFEKRVAKFETQRVGLRRPSVAFRRGLDLSNRLPESQVPRNRAWNGPLHQPIENVVDIQACASTDSKGTAHGFAGIWWRLRNSRSNSSNGTPASPLAMSSSASLM